MHTKRPVVAVVAVVLVTTLASGPFVGAVDLTSEPDRPTFGHGNLTVENTTLPTEAKLSPARFGAGGYELRVPPASLQIRTVTGYPRLLYEIDVHELGHTRSTMHSPPPAFTGEYELTMEGGSIDATDVEADRYRATVSVTRMANHTSYGIASRNVTVEVVE